MSAAPALAPPADGAVTVDVTCTACGAPGRHRCEGVCFAPAELADPDVALPEGWDGFFTSTVLTCGRCGAEDAYELTSKARLELLLRASAALLGGARGVTPGVVRLSDGTAPRRASDGLRQLREAAEARPDEGVGWRRLGNFYERLGRRSEAIAAWERALVDRNEAEAAYSLAGVAEEDGDTGRSYAFAVEALVRNAKRDRGSPPLEPQMIHGLVVGIRDSGFGETLTAAWLDDAASQPVIRVSTARLERLGDWAELARFLVAHDPVSLAFDVDQVDADATTQLEAWLGVPWDSPPETDAWAFPPEPPMATVRPVDRKKLQKKRKAERKARKAGRQRR